MPKFTVIGIIGASASAEVEADTAEDAIDLADVSPSLCHQCAHEVEIGDPYQWEVMDEEGQVVYSDANDESARGNFRRTVESHARTALMLLKAGKMQLAIDALSSALAQDPDLAAASK